VVQIYVDDQSEDPTYASSSLTWYDARENHPTRTEYRLYYKTSPVTDKFHEGDLMILALQTSGQILNIFAKGGSSAENQLKILFGIGEVTNKIEAHTVEGKNDERIDFIRDFILEKLGVVDGQVYKDTAANYLDEMIELFPAGLPSTREFSEFARKSAKVRGMDVDDKLMEWWNMETQLFKLYEKHLFDSTKDKNQNDIDAFIELSLTIQNRRKSRAGFAFENHVEQIFIESDIKYSRTQITENNSKPDFIFPDIEMYRDPEFPATGLHMLGVKTTCKDRWRQVLSEAVRIPHKHLLTLEPGISKNQTDEMKFNNLTLVLPKSIHQSYSDEQRMDLLSVGQFIHIVK
jgi:hypothetical protein